MFNEVFFFPSQTPSICLPAYPQTTCFLPLQWKSYLHFKDHLLVHLCYRSHLLLSLTDPLCLLYWIILISIHLDACNSAVVAAKSLQSYPTPCNPIDGSPPGSPIPGILQARTLEWVAISFSNAWKWSRSVASNSLRPHGLQLTRLLRPWDFPGKSTGVGCHCLLRL